MTSSPFGPSAAEKAASIRADIKAAMRTGELAAPAGAKFSVRAERASLMTSINVTIKGVPATWAATQVPDECRDLAAQITQVIDRHHRTDGRGSFAEVRLESGRAIAFATENGWRQVPR